MAATTQQAPERFSLTRWFALVATLVVTAVTMASGVALEWFISQRLLWQEASLTRDFVQSLVALEQPMLRQFEPGAPGQANQHVLRPFEQLAQMPDVLRANALDARRRVVWSSDAQVIGQVLKPYEELDEALAGHVVIEAKAADHGPHGGEFKGRSGLFVEIYVPVRDPNTQRVLGAIELYKNPRGLTNSLAQLRHYIVLGGLAFGLALLGALIGLVRRADRIMRAQQASLAEAHTQAALGDMGAVVAHGIRNPLAVMRSSAELIADDATLCADGRQAARDIMEQSDRLDLWLRELLAYTRAQEAKVARLDPMPLLKKVYEAVAQEVASQQVAVRLQSPEVLPLIWADALGLEHVLRTVLINAVQASSKGSEVLLSVSSTAQLLQVQVIDAGVGMTEQQLQRAGQPFITTKVNGLGVGLALARRVLERSGGSLQIASTAGHGTCVTIGLRCVE